MVIISKPSTPDYRNNFDSVFSKDGKVKDGKKTVYVYKDGKIVEKKEE